MLTNDGLAHRTGAPLQRSVMVGWTTFHGQVEPWEQEPVKPFRRTPPDPRHARLRCFAAASISLCILTVCVIFIDQIDHAPRTMDVMFGVVGVYIYIYAFVCILHMFLHIVDVLNVFKRWAQMHLVPGISGALQPPNRCAAPEGSGMLSIDAKQRNHHCYGLLGFCWHPSFMVAMLLLNSQCCCWMLLIHIVIPTFCRICDMSLSFSVIILLYPSSSGAYINLHPSLSFLT
jgi:hypothetical protein